MSFSSSGENAVGLEVVIAKRRRMQTINLSIDILSTITRQKIDNGLQNSSKRSIESNRMIILPLIFRTFMKKIICGLLHIFFYYMRIVVQLIESYLKQQIPTILITTDTNKYLFNIPSSFQRFTRQNRIKMPSMAHYFFTKASTATITGLTGLLLTLYDRGESCNSRLYVDEKLFHYFEELRYKMGFKVVPISYCSWGGRSRKGISKFQKIIELSKREDFANVFKNIEEVINTEIPQNEQNNAFKYLNEKQSVFQNDQLQIKPFHVNCNGQLITNFIVIPNPLPGKILNDKLKAFGIKGPSVGEIVKNGKITVNNRQILLSQVKQPDSPAPNIIIFHYNSIQSISEAFKHDILITHLKDPNNFIYSVVHIAEKPQFIVSPEFKTMLSIFPDHVEHLVYNRQYRNSTDNLHELTNLSAQVQLVSSLSKYFPICMPNLQEKHFNFIKNYAGQTQAIDTIFPQKKIRVYKKCHQLVVCPKKSWGYRDIHIAQKQKKMVEEMQPFVLNQNIELDEQMKAKLKIIDPKVIFLGTGSMKPSKYRNVSCILVQFGPQKLLLDCGQGSHIQIAEHYGYDIYQEVLLSIRTIFITHIHSDHNLGILDLISQRNAIIKKRGLKTEENKLFLVLPANVVPWFESFCCNIEDLKEACDVVFIQSLRNQSYSFDGSMSKEDRLKSCSVSSKMVDQSEQNESSEQEEEQLNFIKPQWEQLLRQYGLRQENTLLQFKAYLKSIGIVQFYPTPVIHCPQSYGIVIGHNADIKISYSGDTRPCNQFADAAVGSTLLIHQATFGDDLQRNAFQHFHSTVGQAIDIGMRAKSWKTALTHFSQRYKSSCDIIDPKMYKLNKRKQQYAQKHTIVCFDHMQMNISQCHVMPYYSRGVAYAIPKDNKE